jgi:ABC-2 type transport system permease protein
MRVLGWELRKLAAQRRTFLGLVAAVLIPAAFAIGLAVSPAKPPRPGEPLDPEVVLGLAYNHSGLILPFITLFFSSLVLLPLLAALVAGDIVAAEDGNQTLKTVLTRSTPRLHLLAAKGVAAAMYVLAVLILFGVSGTVIGALAAGAHPITLGGVPLGAGLTLSAPSIGVGTILGRIVLSLAVYAVPLLSVSAWGFMLSTLTRNSAASIVGMLAFSFANQIIGFLPNIPTSVTHWLLTDQFTAWQAALGTSIDSTPLVRAVGVSLLYAIPPVLISAWWFRRRDVLV